MNEQIIKDVFSVYEALKDSIKITKRSINKDLYKLHNRTIFLGEQKEKTLEQMENITKELDDIMILSLFASFERELRISIQKILEMNTNKINSTVAKLSALTLDSIERWTVKDMIDALKDVVPDNTRSMVKQIYEYRNWVAHGRNPEKQPAIETEPKTTYLRLIEFVSYANMVLT